MVGREARPPYDGVARETGVQVDPSGNVWLANNWIAVKSPLVGTPRQP
jgi:hypothetical protein